VIDTYTDKMSGQYVKATKSQFGLGVGNMRFRTTVYQPEPNKFVVKKNGRAVPVIYNQQTGFNVDPTWQSPQMAFALGV